MGCFLESAFDCFACSRIPLRNTMCHFIERVESPGNPQSEQRQLRAFDAANFSDKSCFPIDIRKCH